MKYLNYIRKSGAAIVVLGISASVYAQTRGGPLANGMWDSTGIVPYKGPVELKVPFDPNINGASGATVLGTVLGNFSGVNTSNAPLLISSSLRPRGNCRDLVITVSTGNNFSGNDGCDGGTISNTFVVPVGASFTVTGTAVDMEFDAILPAPTPPVPGSSLNSSITVLSNTPNTTLGALFPTAVTQFSGGIAGPIPGTPSSGPLLCGQDESNYGNFYVVITHANGFVERVYRSWYCANFAV